MTDLTPATVLAGHIVPVSMENAPERVLARSEGSFETMSRHEAEAMRDSIRQDVARVADRIYEFHRRNGHKALGFTSWEAFLQTDPFGMGFTSTSRFYQLVTIGQLQVNVNMQISDRAARALSGIAPDDRITVAKLAASTARLDGDETITPKHIEAAREVWQTTVNGGTPDGYTPLTAAVSETVHEAIMRQKQHIADRTGSVKVYSGGDVTEAIQHLQELEAQGCAVHITIYQKQKG